MMVVDLMTCREVMHSLEGFVAGTLAVDQRAVVEEHLQECEDCRRYLDSYRQTVELGKQTGASADPSAKLELPASLRRAISAARKAGK